MSARWPFEVKDLRIFKDELSAVVFELPLRSDNAEFPPGKLQAHVRVNKTYRSLEDISRANPSDTMPRAY